MISKEELEHCHYALKMNFSQIANKFDVNVSVISKLAKEHKVENSTYNSLPVEEIYQKYLNGISCYKLGKEYGSNGHRIKRMIINHNPNLKIRTMDDAKRPSELNNLSYLKSTTNSIWNIAKEFGVKYATVITAYRKANHESDDYIFPEVDLKRLYWDNSWSLSKISESFGVTKEYVVSLLKKNKISIRSKDLKKKSPPRAMETIIDISDLSNQEKYHLCDWRKIFKDFNECFLWLKEHPFQSIKYSNQVLVEGLNKCEFEFDKKYLSANLSKPNIVNLVKHFSPHYWKSHHHQYLSVADAWNKGNSSVLRGACERMWSENKNCNAHRLFSVISRYFKDFAQVSIFKPWVASYVYHKYLPNGGVVVDPCMGWGGRLLGCIGHNINYRGFDLNPNAIESHNKLYEFIGPLVDATFVQGDSSRVDFPNGDLLFTSPPYDNCEHYHGIDSSVTKTKPILDNIFSKFNGIVVLNLPKRQKDMCVDVAEKHGYKFVEELEMKTASFMGREKTYEPILVFKK